MLKGLKALLCYDQSNVCLVYYIRQVDFIFIISVTSVMLSGNILIPLIAHRKMRHNAEVDYNLFEAKIEKNLCY